MADSAIILKLTHTGIVSSRLYLTDLYDATDGPVTGLHKAGAVYISPSQTIELVFSSSVALSYDRGNIRAYLDLGYLTAAFYAGTELKAAFLGSGVDFGTNFKAYIKVAWGSALRHREFTYNPLDDTQIIKTEYYDINGGTKMFTVDYNYTGVRLDSIVITRESDGAIQTFTMTYVGNQLTEITES